MASKIIHKHSSVITDGKPKIPTENQLEYGELAINYGKGVETISFKNTNNEIVEIKTKNYFDEKILLNSKDINSLEDKVNDIKSTIENNELVTATALSDLDDKINSIGNELTDKSDKEHIHVSSAITDSISSMTDITETASGLVQGKAVYELINDTEEQITETLLEHDTRINNILVEIENNELVTASAISDLDVRINDIKLNVENNELITAAAITNLEDRTTNIENSNYLDKFLTNILYSDLVSLKNESKLIPGMQYRITDYVTTCAEHGNHFTQVNTYSANHNFDIIVVADTVNTINENARAIQHEGDTYFANCNLSAWELKYTLDNNPEIFRWANTENGKGVIYYMKDENNNECMYDFKNIQYDIPSMSILGTYWIFDISKYDTYSIGFEPNKKYYTFSYVSDSGEILDGSIVKIGKSISIAMDNKIGIANPWEYINDLPVIVLLSLPTTHEIMKKYNITARNINSTNIEQYCEFLFLLAPMERNYFGQCNRYNIIGPSIFQNKFGDYMLGNFMGYDIVSNFIKTHFQNNNIGNTCVYNVIESSSVNNTIGDYFVVNYLGSYTENNVFGNDCIANKIGNYFIKNNIGNYFESNNIGNDVCENTMGDDWWGNIIGNDVCNNIFGSVYKGNNFGNYFYYNKFVMNNNSDAETLNNVSYCIFNNYIKYNVFYPDVENFTQEDFLVNLYIHNGIHGSEEEYNYIGIPYINNDYEININKNSNNELKIYCEADLIA